MNRDLFRVNAMKKISSVEQLDSMYHVISIKTWAIWLGCLLISAGILIWLFNGNVCTEVNSEGFCTQNVKLINLYTTCEGVIDEVDVQVGEWVKKNQLIAIISGKPVYCETSGMVHNIFIEKGQYFQDGKMLEVMQSKDVENTQYVYTYLPLGQSAKLEKGMNVYLSGTNSKHKDIGNIKGKILSSNTQIVSGNEMYQRLGDMSLVQKFCNINNGEPLCEVVIQVDKDEDVFENNTIVSLKIICETQSPIQKIFQ